MVYLGLYAGMTISASIPAAIMSMGILRLFKNSNILENNIVQTAASAGESLAELDHRVTEACNDLLVEASELNVAVFTHVSPIKSTIAWALGVEEQISWRLQVGQAQISRIAVRDGRPVLTSFNETSHLTSF